MKGRFHSIAAKIILSIALSMLVIFSIQIYLNVSKFQNDLVGRVEDYLIAKANEETEKVQSDFFKIDQGAKGLTSLIAASTIDNYDLYMQYMTDLVTDLDLVMGVGFWMEPYIFDKNQEYYGPYLYKDQGELVLTWDYSNSDYDYFTYDWYTNGFTDKGSVWSEPFYDEVTGVTMMTYTSPILHDQKIIGVTTFDVDLNDMENYIKTIQVGKTGLVYLVGDNGNLIVNPDHNEGKINLTKSKLSNLATSIISSKDTEVKMERIAGETCFVAYSPIAETGLKLVITLPVKELGLTENVKFSIIVSLVSMVIFFGLIYLLIRFIVIKPIHATSNYAEIVAQGNLVESVDERYLKRQDEIGNLARSFETMRTNLQQMIGQIVATFTQISEASNELNESGVQVGITAEQVGTSIEDVASGVEEQSAQLDETSVTMSKLRERIVGIEESTGLLTEDALIVKQKVDEGTQAIDKSIEKIKLVKDETLQVSEAIHTLGEMSSEIGGIIQMINGISNQTNLLALNAAIEAARAGEYGRGFSVVAAEIRQLAEESAAATNKIAELIKGIQSGVSGSITTIKKNAELVDHSVEAIEDTGRVFGEVEELTHKLTTILKTIADDVTDMSQNSIEVERVVSNINAVGSELADNAEEVAASSEEQVAVTEEIVGKANQLAEMAAHLEKAVNEFKIK